MVARVPKEAHGLVADEITEVAEGLRHWYGGPNRGALNLAPPPGISCVGIKAQSLFVIKVFQSLQ